MATSWQPAHAEMLQMVKFLPDPPPLTERFLAAVALAEEVHGRDRRAGTEIPYLAHLLVVTGLVIEDGGGRALLDRIERSFGARVAGIVERLSDTIEPDTDTPWIERKVRYLEQLEACQDESTLRVALCDKVHNARSIVRDYRVEGHLLWERFTQKTAQQQLWYYGRLVDLFSRKRPGALTEDLRNAVLQLETMVAADGQDSAQ